MLTESWHGSSDDLSLRLAMPPNFSFVDYIRPHDPHHGGLIVYFKSLFKYVKFDLPTVKSFEAIIIKFFIHRLEIILLAIYRPGSVPPSTLFLSNYPPFWSIYRRYHLLLYCLVILTFIWKSQVIYIPYLY